MFQGRPRIPGIEPGARLVAEGMVGDWGRRQAILNPDYELIAGREATVEPSEEPRVPPGPILAPDPRSRYVLPDCWDGVPRPAPPTGRSARIFVLGGDQCPLSPAS